VGPAETSQTTLSRQTDKEQVPRAAVASSIGIRSISKLESLRLGGEWFSSLRRGKSFKAEEAEVGTGSAADLGSLV